MTTTSDPSLDLRLAELSVRARDGDRAAFEALFALAAERARLYVRLRLGRAMRAGSEVDDVLQEGWAEAWRSIGTFEPRGRASFSRWLCRVLENRIRDLADRAGAAKRRPDAAFERVSRIADLVPADATGVATRAARAEEQERLAAAVDALPDDERAVVLARFFEDRTIDEIAASSGRSPTAVRRLLGRAVRLLGAALGDAR